MKKILLTVLASVPGLAVSHATVTSVPTWNYSGGIYCYQPVLSTDGSGGQSVTLNGNQWLSWGTMGMAIQTDTAADPTLTINNNLNNESSFVWTEYVVSVAMNQTFTIGSAIVNLPSGWTESISQPTLQGGSYVGSIDYSVMPGGIPVAIYPGANSTFDYSYQITFSGSTSYSFTESASAVPEPNGLSLLMVGGLLMGVLLAGKRLQRVSA